MKDPKATLPAGKQPYVKPKLVRYGDVRLLTQVQTMGSAEGSMGTGIMRPGSDRRLKQGILEIGRHPLGIGLYLFEYRPEFRDRHGHGVQFGVMADEVREVLPDAVSADGDGFMSVDYELLAATKV